MTTKKLYQYLAIVSGSIGLGMIFGQAIGNGTSSAPYWFGGILILLSALLTGMAISSNQNTTPAPKTDQNQENNQ